MNRSLTTLAVCLVMGMPAAAQAQQKKLHSELRSDKLRERLTGMKVETLMSGAWEYSFDSDTDASYRGAQGSQGEGRWWLVKGGGVKATFTARGGPCHREEDDCDATWTHKMYWHKVRLSDSGLLTYYENGCEGNSRNVCAPLDSESCWPASGAIVKIVPGNKNRVLYEKTVTTVLGLIGAGKDFIGVAGKPAKTPRSTTEIWWVKDPCARNSDAKKKSAELATLLTDTIGKVDVQEWTFGDIPYDIVLVVGKTKAGGAAQAGAKLKIKVLNGGCPSKAACKNPSYDAVKTAVANSGIELVADGVAKKKRDKTEVWYKAGKKEAAKAYLEQTLKGKVSAEGLREWKWGGDFDLLIVVAQPN
jgi:hypothetical protein